MKRIILAASAALFLAVPAIAGGSPIINSVDLIADPEANVGYRWTVSCSITSPGICAVNNPKGSLIGSVKFEMKELTKDDRVRVLTECAGVMPRRECWALLTGDLSDDGGQLKLKDAKLEWQAP